MVFTFRMLCFRPKSFATSLVKKLEAKRLGKSSGVMAVHRRDFEGNWMFYTSLDRAKGNPEWNCELDKDRPRRSRPHSWQMGRGQILMPPWPSGFMTRHFRLRACLWSSVTTT